MRSGAVRHRDQPAWRSAAQLAGCRALRPGARARRVAASRANEHQPAARVEENSFCSDPENAVLLLIPAISPGYTPGSFPAYDSGPVYIGYPGRSEARAAFLLQPARAIC